MKHVVVKGDLEEATIRPASLLSELRQLSIEDARRYFADASALEESDCPACRSASRTPAFERDGFAFSACADCASVYANPRPTAAALTDYYASSRAARFRTERFVAETAEARRTEIISSHANWLGRIYDETGNREATGYADVGTTNPAVFDEIQRLDLFAPLCAIDPAAGVVERCRDLGIEIAEQGDALGVVTAFETLEHQHAPDSLLQAAHQSLAPGGLLFFTTRTISGFDLQTLWGRAPYIYVPEHLNLLSIEGIRRLLERSGFEAIEISTPGRLDVELVLHAIEADPTIHLTGFVDTLLRHRDHRAHQDFQAFLQKHRLSSHLRVAALKKESQA